MNEQIQKMLETLATKFGTTVEKLWDVLVTQARIEAVCNTVYLAVLITVWFFFIKFVRRFIQWQKDASDEGMYVAGFALVVLGSHLLTILTGFGGYSMVSTIITGFFNPEFWALKQIIKP